MAGTLLAYADEAELKLDDATVRFHLVEMIRADGPRAGHRMAWGVWDTIERDTRGAIGVVTFNTVQEAVEALDIARDSGVVPLPPGSPQV